MRQEVTLRPVVGSQWKTNSGQVGSPHVMDLENYWTEKCVT